MTETDTCRTCPAPVVWRKHERTGKAAPVDRYPVPTGNVVLVGADAYRVLTKAEMAEMDTPKLDGLGDPDPDRYTLHFATCPDAPTHRRR